MNGRSVLITGGSKGIGLTTARLFAEAGYRTAVTYHSSPPPEGLFAVKCDVADTQSVKEAFAAVEAEQGPVEVLVSCAGITADGPLMMMSDDKLERVINTNLLGAGRVARQAVRKMTTARWGRLIFISSAVGLRGETGQANYAASKAGLVGLARSLARELGTRGITSNVVSPGLIHTEMVTSTLSEAKVAHLVEQIPTGRIGHPEDVADAILWLAGDGAAYVNGAVIPVDGGAGMGH